MCIPCESPGGQSLLNKYSSNKEQKKEKKLQRNHSVKMKEQQKKKKKNSETCHCRQGRDVWCGDSW